MNYRKFALLIHVDDGGLTILGKTCRYCPACELIIAHQHELEAELANSFSARDPHVIGNPYLVMGTVDWNTWREGLQSSVTVERLREQTADFKRYLKVFSEPGGWVPKKRNT